MRPEYHYKTEKSTHRWARLTCITLPTCITFLTCITCITHVIVSGPSVIIPSVVGCSADRDLLTPFVCPFIQQHRTNTTLPPLFTAIHLSQHPLSHRLFFCTTNPFIKVFLQCCNSIALFLSLHIRTRHYNVNCN